MTYERDTEHGPALNATRARQGRWGRHVFWVLVFGTLLAALGMFAAWTWKSPDLASTEPTQFEAQQKAQTFDAPEPVPPSSQAPRNP
jgi:hypothetical protein